MADVLQCGRVTVIANKKCGSSQINRTFRGKEYYGDRRWLSSIRYPLARLPSCWNHLVRFRVGDIDSNIHHPFGPARPFEEWLEWVFEQDPETLNPHIRPQYLEVMDAIEGAPGTQRLMLIQLERITELRKDMATYCCAPATVKKSQNVRDYESFPKWYDRKLRKKATDYFSTDMSLWFGMFEKGYQITTVESYRKRLTNVSSVRR